MCGGGGERGSNRRRQDEGDVEETWSVEAFFFFSFFLFRFFSCFVLLLSLLRRIYDSSDRFLYEPLREARDV